MIYDDIKTLILQSIKLGNKRYGSNTQQNDDFRCELELLESAYYKNPEVWKAKLEQFLVLANLSNNDLTDILELV